MTKITTYLILSLLLLCNIVNSQIITITPEMVTNESAYLDAYKLFDEASIAGDPLNNNGGNPTTRWHSYINSDIFYPLEATVDLGTDYQIDHIYIYSSNGSERVEFSSGQPFNWNLIGYDNLTTYNQWNSHSVNRTTRYLQFKIFGVQGFINEIVIYGSMVGSAPTPPTATPHTYPLMEDFLGINSFHDDDFGKQQVVKFIREYHMWPWDQQDQDLTGKYYPNNEYAFSPSVVAGWDFDEYYRKSDSAGLEISPCLLYSPTFYPGTGDLNWDSIDMSPILPTADPLLPSSYIERADYLYQFAARYGKTTVPNSNLKLRNDNPLTSGLGYINYMEDWNEQNKHWKGRRGYFNPYEYAAMLSADYDGHQGSLGTTVGIKNADPTMKVSMAGLALVNIEYIKAMKQWSDFNRGGSFPADILNVHFYSNDVGGQTPGQIATHAISPEDDNVKQKLQELIDYRDTYMPNKEVWVSEFGYDTEQSSPIKCIPYGPFNEYDVQAMWMIRTFLALSSTGLDRAQMYMLRDVWDVSPVQFDTGGLLHDMFDTIHPRYEPKVSWYYLYTTRNRLGRTKFKQEVNSGNSNVLVYEYENGFNTDSTVYALWCPTSNNTIVNGHSLNIGIGATSATLVTMRNNDTIGLETPLTITGNSVSINVSENPSYVIVNRGVSSVNEIEQQNSFKLYPSIISNNELINISMSEAKKGDLFIEIMNAEGKIVQSKKFANNNSQLLQVQVKNLNKGIYLVRLRNGNYKSTERLVIR